MYGYVDEIKQQLSKEELARYRTYYCRICNALSLRYGYRYRLLVNYDVVTYMIITKLAIGDEFYCYKFRCQAKHLRGMSEFKKDELGQFFAMLTARGMSVAVEDKIQDGGKKKYKFFSWFFKKAFKPNDEKEKGLVAKVSARMKELLALERANSKDVKLYLNYYADSILLCIDEYYPNIGEPYKELIRQIACFTDYMDMLQDYDDDVKEKAFNPLVEEGLDSLQAYLGKHWQDVRNVTEEMTRKLNLALDAIRKTSPVLEWEILAKTVKLVVPQTVRKVITGNTERTSFLPTD